MKDRLSHPIHLAAVLEAEVAIAAIVVIGASCRPMSDNINFSGSVQRFLKGDADPINLFGFNPTRAEMRANEADRGRRASQISAEQNSASIRAAGGITDAPTKQVARLRNRTGNVALSPFNPVPLPSVTITNVAIAEKKKADNRSARKRTLAATNKRNADTALTKDNLQLLAKPSSGATRFSETRLRRSILGRQGRAT